MQVLGKQVPASLSRIICFAIIPLQLSALRLDDAEYQLLTA